MKLPVGIDDFKKIRKGNFYYIDKTKLIEQLLDQWGEVNLFTRPRRFGKTLNMSMLQSFFEIGTDKSLFDGLYISENTGICEKHMGQYPVIFLTLKSVEGLDFESARNQLSLLVGSEMKRLGFLLDSDKLDEEDKKIYSSMLEVRDGQYAVKESALPSSLKTLSGLLFEHYGKNVIILIDEYDVPLDKAFSHGYYNEMVSLLRGMLGQALKTNEYLHFAVLTGCLRISKESIFTGLNNFKVLSIADPRFDEQFGFTDEEVRKLLADYDLGDRFDETKEWYDGYHFGNTDVYCPWDVICHVDRLSADPEAEPQAYWINSSGNALVKRFIYKANKTTKMEIEQLIAGGAIEKKLHLELTYDEIDNSVDNLWSVLFTTGYLTQEGRAKNGIYRLVIPNKEIREVYISQIQEWFAHSISNDTGQVRTLLHAFESADAETAESCLTRILSNTISVLDTKAKNEEKEIFYHGIMLGLLKAESEWLVRSNEESGDGYADILVETEDVDTGIIFELKYVLNMKDMDEACKRAMEQIQSKRYDERFRNDGKKHILAYGIAFCRKRCRVYVEKM